MELKEIDDEDKIFRKIDFQHLESPSSFSLGKPIFGGYH